LTIAKNKQEKKRAFNGEIFITDIYILGKPWKNIHIFWNIWMRVLGNMEMYKNRPESDKFATY